MYRRKRFRTYYRRGRPVIGFYKDSKGRTRPITPRVGRRRVRYVPTFRISLPKQRIQVGKPFLNGIISYMLSQAPVARELYTSWILADALYKSWSSISQLMHEKEGWQGVTSVIGSDIVRNTLSSVKTDIVWATISSFIPKEYHSIGKRILANVMDRVTSEEIKLVKQFLQRSEESDNRLRLQEHSETELGSLKRKAKKLPKEINYV